MHFLTGFNKRAIDKCWRLRSVKSKSQQEMSIFNNRIRDLLYDFNIKVCGILKIFIHAFTLWLIFFKGRGKKKPSNHFKLLSIFNLIGITSGTTDWFQIGKGVRQGCILSPCLFDFYADRVHHEKRWTGRNTSWNQDCWEKYQ